jgi:hypothetical protein
MGVGQLLAVLCEPTADIDPLVYCCVDLRERADPSVSYAGQLRVVELEVGALRRDRDLRIRP